jgi:multisubunit Na+/H+ antiporter MnhE subunit
MLHAAAMLAGFFGIGLLLTQGWMSRDLIAVTSGVALATVALALLLGGVRKNPFSTAPQFITLIVSRLGAVLRGALATTRAALAADVTLRPALVRVRADEAGPFAHAGAADAISAAPGSVVVETDSEGMLVHVLNEEATDSAALTAVQSRAISLLGARG